MSPTRPTRTRLRSSATEPYTLEQCIRTINDQFRRPRNPSAPGGGEGRSTPAGGASDSRRNASDPRRNASDQRRGASENASENSSGAVGGASEDIPLEIPLETDASNRGDNTNRVALNVWNQLLCTNDVMGIIGDCPFTRGLQNLLNVQQQEEVIAVVKRDIINRKADFIKTKDTYIPKLILSLQESFTKIVIRHVRSELDKSKYNTIARIEQFEKLDEQVVNKWNIRKDKATVKADRFKEAQEGINTLLNIVNNRLEEIVQINLVVGTPETTMTSIGNFLNKVVEDENIELPDIINEEREAGNDDQSIYRSDFNQLSQDVKDCYAEAAKLIVQANQAEQEENDALADYICAELESNNLRGAQLIDVKEKLIGIKKT